MLGSRRRFIDSEGDGSFEGNAHLCLRVNEYMYNIFPSPLLVIYKYINIEEVLFLFTLSFSENS